ncbi:hypothetical protein NQ314_000960 [Rhamnusium bicolor]|uniref:Uncharacterized protein n=1 Tax=Rhamnusium bicolor TaxID=1586634 RepID=A0AAV8ZUG0_9CUCU|nr:hypothetical protein NQ314_000960 [Rhamnusium bicolor]
MGIKFKILHFLLQILVHISSAQLPPRPLSIPGAVLIQGARPAPIRQSRINSDFAPRPRRPPPGAIPAPLREVRPVVEEEEEEQQESASPNSSFDAEVNKLGISALASAVRQAASDDSEEPTPLPVLRPLPAPVPRPVLRQERPIARQEIDDEDDLPIRQTTRKARPQAPLQQFRPAPPPRAPKPQYEDDGSRTKKPPVEILRKYRTDNPDGSITQYSYETGNKCDQQEEEPEEEPLPRIQPKKPLNSGKQQPQFRPPGSQY